MVSKRISEIIGTDYKNWSRDNLIFIKAGTGTGKSYFIKNVLSIYAKEKKKKILFLTNRDNLKKQILNDIGIYSNIDVLNYQKLEDNILNDFQFNISDYDYVVMDEGQYFFSDASFSIKTDLFFKKMLSDNSICKIIMTATPRLLLFYFNRNKIKVDYEYELATNYDYISNITTFSKDECLDNIIANIPKDEQIIYFGSAKKALELSQKFKGAFICSQYNNEYWKYVNKDELNDIIEKSEFKSHILCTTTALENGVNIKEGTPVKHIIIDILDRDTFMQCLGRKRIGEGEEINLYFNSYSNNKKINGLKKKISDALEQADFLIQNGEKEYINKNYKQNNTYNRIVDEVWNDSENKSVKVVNECIYTKYKELLLMYKTILGKDKGLAKKPYKCIIANTLGINEDDITDIDGKIQVQTLESMLEDIEGKKLFNEEQNELIEFIGLKADGKLSKSRETFNAYFKEKKISYTIEIPKRKSYRDECGKVKKEKSYWVVRKLEH